jgi:hypothetical protein
VNRALVRAREDLEIARQVRVAITGDIGRSR